MTMLGRFEEVVNESNAGEDKSIGNKRGKRG